MVSQSGGSALWRSSFAVRITPSATETLRFGDLQVQPDGSSLLSLIWTGQLILPNDTIEEHFDAIGWATLLVRLSAEGEILWTRRLQIEENNTLCEDIEPTPEGWIVSCYGGSGLGLTLSIDEEGQSLWQHDTSPLPSDEMNYAYLFQATRPLGSRLFVGGWTGTGADLDGLAYESFGQPYFIAGLDFERGETLWAVPDPGSNNSRLAVSPETGTLLAARSTNNDAEDRAILLDGRDPSTGGVLWTCRYTFEQEPSLRALHRSGPLRWSLTGSLVPEEGDDREFFLMELDSDHRATSIMIAPRSMALHAALPGSDELVIAFGGHAGGVIELFGQVIPTLDRVTVILARVRRF